MCVFSCMHVCLCVSAFVHIPIPAARVKAAYRVRMDRAKGISGSTASYPHAEATLSDIALKGSAELSEDSNFG